MISLESCRKKMEVSLRRIAHTDSLEASAGDVEGYFANYPTLYLEAMQDSSKARLLVLFSTYVSHEVAELMASNTQSECCGSTCATCRAANAEGLSGLDYIIFILCSIVSHFLDLTYSLINSILKLDVHNQFESMEFFKIR